MTALRFDDRVVVVTGAGRGIGRSHAKLLASKGARVVVADYGVGIHGDGASGQPATEVVEEIRAGGGDAVACFASVAQQRSAASIVETAVDTYGRIDAVINNAGIHDPGDFDQLSVDQFRRMLDIHYFGTLFVIQAAWPHFARAGYGRVVNTVSEAALGGGLPQHVSYAAAKGAVFGLTRSLAVEGVSHGIRVNALAPRAFTRMSASQSHEIGSVRQHSDEAMREINASMPPELCAPGAAFLAHETCPLNGEVLRVGLGGVARIAVVHSQGIPKVATAEDIRDNLDQIMDLSDASIADAVREP